MHIAQVAAQAASTGTQFATKIALCQRILTIAAPTLTGAGLLGTLILVGVNQHHRRVARNAKEANRVVEAIDPLLCSRQVAQTDDQHRVHLNENLRRQEFEGHLLRAKRSVAAIEETKIKELRGYSESLNEMLNGLDPKSGDYPQQVGAFQKEFRSYWRGLCGEERSAQVECRECVRALNPALTKGGRLSTRIAKLTGHKQLKELRHSLEEIEEVLTQEHRASSQQLSDWKAAVETHFSAMQKAIEQATLVTPEHPPLLSPNKQQTARRQLRDIHESILRLLEELPKATDGEWLHATIESTVGQTLKVSDALHSLSVQIDLDGETVRLGDLFPTPGDPDPVYQDLSEEKRNEWRRTLLISPEHAQVISQALTHIHLTHRPLEIEAGSARIVETKFQTLQRISLERADKLHTGKQLAPFLVCLSLSLAGVGAFFIAKYFVFPRMSLEH